MLIPFLLFLFGLLLLVKGGDWFVGGATGIAYRLHLPELLIGATVVSVGTTLPEVTVSVTSALGGTGDIAYGNALGSVICNTALVAAIPAVLRPTSIDRKQLLLPVSFFFIAATVYFTAAYGFGEFSRETGILLLTLFVLYTVISLRNTKAPKDPPTSTQSKSTPEVSADPAVRKQSLGSSFLLLVVGAAAIAVGADLLVENGRLLAEQLGLPESVMAMLFVSLGTSLPELVTAVSALLKGHSALSLGNIIGANVLNLTLVTGAAATAMPFALPDGRSVAGIPSTLLIDLPLMLLVMLLLTLPTLIKGRLTRALGITLLCSYVAFCVLSVRF